MKKTIKLIFLLIISSRLFAQEEPILSNFSTALEAKDIGVKLTMGIPKDVVIEDENLSVQLSYELGYLMVFKSSDIDIKNIISALSATYSWQFSATKKYIFLVPKAFYSNSTDLMYFLDGSLADSYIMQINDWYNNDIQIDSLIGVANSLRSSIADKNIALKKMQGLFDSLQNKKNQLGIEEAIADKNLQSVDLRSAKLIGGGGEDDPKKFFENILNLIKNIRIKELKDYDKIKDKDIFLKAYENLMKNLEKEKFKYYDATQTKNPFLHEDLMNAINEINKNEKESLTKMGLYPLKVIGAARTPLNQLVQICNRPKVAAGMFSSGHVSGCAADLANPSAIEKNHVELSKLLGKYGMTFIRNEKQRKGDPNHIFLSAFLDNPTFSKKLQLSLFKAMNKAIEDADNEQKIVIDGAIISCKRSKDAIKNLSDATKALKDKSDKLEKEVKDMQDRVNSKNQKYADKLKQIALEMAVREKKDGTISKDKEREYFGEGGRADKEGYWEKNSREEWHDRQNDVHCYREIHENSYGRSESHGCTAGSSREFSGGRQH